jgi:hypothetical protein
MHDVPSQLGQMGVEVTDGLAKAQELGDRDVLKKFEILPKLFSGRQITIEFSIGALRPAFTEDCVALHLEPGTTIASHVTIDSGQTFYIYGERDIAIALMSLPKNSTVRAIANTALRVIEFSPSRQRLVFSPCAGADSYRPFERKAATGHLN